MIAQCSECRVLFDSHDGGSRCFLCGRTACQKCEGITFDSPDRANSQGVCKQCSDSPGCLPMPGAFLYPDSKLWRLVLRNARIVADYRGGLSQVAVGQKHNISWRTVQRILQDNQEPSRGPGAPKGPRPNWVYSGKLPPAYELRALRNDGVSFRKIGRLYGVSGSAVSDCLRRAARREEASSVS